MAKDSLNLTLIIFSILGGGAIITLMSGDWLIWIPIVLAFVVTARIAREMRW